MSRSAPWELDPTYLEQTGLDPQQVWKRTTTEVQRNAPQATSPSPNSTPPPSPTQNTSSTVSSPPPSSSTVGSSSPNAPAPRPDGGSSARRSEPWRLDPTHLEQTGLDPQQVRREVETAVRQSTAPRSASATPQSGSSPPSRSTAPGNNAAQNAGGSSTRRPEFWRLDPTYLEQSGLDPEHVRREIDAAVRQIVSQKLTGQSFSPPGSGVANIGGVIPADRLLDQMNTVNRSPGLGGHTPTFPSAPPDFSKLFERLTGVPTLGSYLQTPPPNVSGSSTAAPSNRQPTGNARVIPADYLLDQLNPVNIVNRLTTAYDRLKEELEQTVLNYSDVLKYNNNRIDMSDVLKENLSRYRQAVDELGNLPKLESWLMMALGDKALVVDADAGPPDLYLTPNQLDEWRKRTKNAKVIVTRSGSGIDIQFTPDVQSTVQDANRLLTEIWNLDSGYWRQVEDVINRFNAASGKFRIVVRDGVLDIDTSVHEEGFKKVKQLNDEYDARLNALATRYGVAITVGKDGKLVVSYTDPSKYREFLVKVNELDRWYNARLSETLNEHGLKVEGNRIVIDMSIYGDVFNKINEINRMRNEKLRDIYSRYSHLLGAVADEEGRTVYTLRPEVQNALTLHNLVSDIVNIHGATVQQTVQDIVNRYGDVLSYDPKTGRIAPSKELAEMLGRYENAVQEVSRLINTMSAVAGMIQTTAQQLPVLTARFQAYDRATNQFVETGGETPIYIRDEKMREEIRNWMRQNEGKVKVAAFYDQNKPVVYVYNDRDEGYMIFPATGEARRARGVSGMVDDTARAMWYRSLTDKERKELEQYYRLQWEKEQSMQKLQNLPPVVRELYGALLSAGQFAPISSSADIVVRAILGREDPLAGAKKIHTQAEAVKEVSPAAYYAGTGIGLAGLVGLGAEAILARGAAKLAAQGAKAAADDAVKSAVVKKPKLPSAADPIQYVQQAAKSPTVLQTAAAGLKDAAVPMAVSGAVFGGLEGARSYLETGKVDVSRVLEGAAFGSLLGAFPLTKREILAALGVGAGATAGASLVRGYDPATSLAVGEAAGLTVVVGGGTKNISKADAKHAKASAADAAVVRPEGRPTPKADLAGIDLTKRLTSAVGNTVADVIAGRVSVEEANLRLGAYRDAVPDKALFDRILQDYKTLVEPPRTPMLDFATAAKRAAEVVSAAESGKMPEYRAFIELADMRASTADKARFDRRFGEKLGEYGERYVQWVLGSGLDRPSAVLHLAKYEDVLGRRLIERYVPDYGKVLAEVEAKLSQLKPVSPREAPAVKLTPEDVYTRSKSLFDDVVEGRKDWFKASEELYKMWRDAPPEVRADLEAALNVLNRLYGEKYGVTLEPWRPSPLESIQRRAELFAADVRSAVENVLRSIESFRQRLEGRRVVELQDEYIDVITRFRTRQIGLEEARRRLLELAKKAEKADRDLADWFRKKAEELGREPAKETPKEPPQKQPEMRLPDEKDVEWIRRAEEERRRMGQREREEGGGRGQRLLLLEEESRFRDADALLQTAKRAASKSKGVVRNMEDSLRRMRSAELYDELLKALDAYNRGEMGVDTAKRLFTDIIKKMEDVERDIKMKMIDKTRRPEAGDALLSKMKELAAEVGDSATSIELTLRYGRMRGLFEDLLNVLDAYRRGEVTPDVAKQRLTYILKDLEKVDRNIAEMLRNKLPDAVRPAETLPATKIQQLLAPEVRSALVQTLEVRTRKADAIPEAALAPEIGLAQETRQKLAETSRLLKSPRGDLQLLRIEQAPEEERRPFVAKPLTLQVEPPQYAKPWIYVLKTPERTSQYEPISVSTTSTTPTMATIPSPPTYTSTTVPKISEVSAVDVPTVPTYETTPTPLPPRWWRIIPPSVFIEDAKEGAYKVQAGKRQILLLA